MQIALNIKNANPAIFKALSAFLKTQPSLDYELTKKTINGYSPKFEAEILKDLDGVEPQTFKSVKDFRRAVDNGEI